jgi:hypothetical protein
MRIWKLRRMRSRTKREQVVNRSVNKIGPATIATEGDEVRLAGLVKPPEITWHERNLYLRRRTVSDPRLAQLKGEPGAQDWNIQHFLIRVL